MIIDAPLRNKSITTWQEKLSIEKSVAAAAAILFVTRPTLCIYSAPCNEIYSPRAQAPPTKRSNLSTTMDRGD